MSHPDEQGEGAGEQSEPADSTTDDTGDEAPPEGADEGGQPDIEGDEQAVVPAGLADVDPDEIEEVAGAGDDDREDVNDAADPATMEPDGAASSPAKAGEMYVSLVQSLTNANIRKYGGPDAEPVDRDHFEQYDLSEHFNATMDQMGVGSDLEPHEALLLATVLSVGDGLTRETDVLDDAIGQLMDKAIGAEGAA